MSAQSAQSTQHVRVVARIIALPDKVDEVKTILMGLIAPTRQEAGCITYELEQNQHNPTDFVLVEEWESNAHLDAHLNTPHLKQAVAAFEGVLVAPPDIQRYTLLA